MDDDEKVDLSAKNKQNFEEMKGKYVNYDEYQGNEYPTVNQMINIDFDKAKVEEKKQIQPEENVENKYGDFA